MTESNPRGETRYRLRVGRPTDGTRGRERRPERRRGVPSIFTAQALGPEASSAARIRSEPGVAIGRGSRGGTRDRLVELHTGALTFSSDDASDSGGSGSEKLAFIEPHSGTIGDAEPDGRSGVGPPESEDMDADPSGMLLFPNPDMPYAVAATAWTQVLGCDTYRDKPTLAALRAFIEEHRGNGYEDVPVSL